MRKIALIIFVLLLFKTPVYAQTSTASAISIPANFQYDLPYPGLLPGSTLYPIKILRDRIVEFFITDSVRKADFYLLSADKHLSAGIILFDKNKKDLSETTISKGENYLEMALSNAKKGKRQQESADDVLNRIYLSSRKHEEVISNLINQSSGELKKKLLGDLNRAMIIEKSAK